MKTQNTVNRKSGPYPSLQSESREVREVQFEVQQLCPIAWPQHEWRFESFAVWVKFPGYREESTSRCTGIRYDETPEGYEAMLAHGFAPGYRAVCEHMGRVIE